MKKSLLVFVSSCFLIFCGSEIYAQKYYLHTFCGVNYILDYNECLVSDLLEPGYIVGTGIGYKRSPFRFEIELAFRENQYSRNTPLLMGIFLREGFIRKFTTSANIFYDFETDIVIPFLRPYIGIGVGHKIEREILYIDLYGIDSRKTDIIEYKGVGFSSQFIIGAGMPFSKNTITKLEYRFLNDYPNEINHSFIVNMDYLF